MSDPVSARYKEALRRGHVAVVKGRPREAIKHYAEAGQLAPQRPLPFTSMGSVYLQMQQPREALAAYGEALGRAPDDVDAMRGTCMALEAMGRIPEARALRTRVAEMEAMEHAGRGAAAASDRRSLELERHVIAGAQARAAGDLDTACAAYLTAANGYSAANDLDVSLDACLRALEARPGNIDVHFTMAVMYLRRGWVELAVQRVQLIEHRLDIDDDRRRRDGLHALARDYRTLAPELERLAASPVR